MVISCPHKPYMTMAEYTPKTYPNINVPTLPVEGPGFLGGKIRRALDDIGMSQNIHSGPMMRPNPETRRGP